MAKKANVTATKNPVQPTKDQPATKTKTSGLNPKATVKKS